MLLAGATVLAAAAPAHAGTYTVYACKKPDGTPAQTEGWAYQDAVPSAAAERDASRCQSSGGPMRLALNAGVGHAQGSGADLVFKAPPGLPIVGYVMYRNAYAASEYNYDLLEDGQVTPENCRGNCIRGSASAPLSESSAWTRPNLRVGELRFRVSCGTGSGEPPMCQPQSPSPSSVDVHRAEIVLEDDSDPEFTSPPSGTLFDTSRELNGVVSASFGAKDTGSGVFQAVIEVDGQPVVTSVIDDNGGKCRKPFTSRVPCKAGATAAGTISLDTAVLPDGPHNVRLLVQDATGTNAIPYGPVSITTRNSVPGRGTPNGTNATDGAILQVKWKGRKSRELKSRFNRSVAVEGTLRNPAGQPIVGATLVLARTEIRPGAREGTLGTVTTKADGTFGHRFRARPGMRIAVRYRAFAGDARDAAEQKLTLRVRAAATLKTSKRVKRGTQLRFSGRLRGGPIPRGGKIVQLQFRKGRRWINSGGIEKTDRRGRFKGSVGTQRGGGRETVTLRLLIPREASYPYSHGYSRTRRVLLVP
jgi:hypothetical protein